MKGDSMMIKGGELHSLSLEVGKSITAIVVHPTFWTGDDSALFEKFDFTAIFRTENKIGSEICRILRRVKELYRLRPTGYEFILKAYFCNLFAILLESGEYEENSAQNERSVSHDTALFEYVHRHLCEELSLAYLSNVFHFSKSYIIRLFKKHTGQTPTEYVSRCRVEHAKELLLSKSVTDTALDCGFNNVSYFIRAFKRYTGKTPGQWKSVN